MRKAGLVAAVLAWALLCTAAADRGEDEMDGPYTVNTKISDVTSDPVFGSWGRLIFPADEGYWSGETLKDLRLTWYSNIDPDKTVEICSYLHDRAAAGKSVSDYLGHGERIVYVSVLNNISIDCDCDGNPAEPDIHDIGILASTDPVAIDLCFAAEGSESLQARVERQNGLHTLEAAEQIGLGSRTYELVNIDV